MPLVAKGPKKLGTAEEEQNGKAKAQEVLNAFGPFIKRLSGLSRS